jgi:uncharacterized ferredoxin-like protein
MATEELELTQEIEEESEDLEDDVDDANEPEDADAEAAPAEGEDDETVEALEELESEELALLDEEVNEALLVDEVKELKAIRREELTMNVDAQAQRSDEFVCQSCFLVKRTSQLANRKQMLCTDCAY